MKMTSKTDKEASLYMYNSNTFHINDDIMCHVTHVNPSSLRQSMRLWLQAAKTQLRTAVGRKASPTSS